jgi:hypothetical protein
MCPRAEFANSGHGVLLSAECGRYPCSRRSDLANEFAIVSGPTDDLLDRHSVSDERHDCGINPLASQIAFIFELFFTSALLWIDCRSVDRGADHAYRAAYGFEQSHARIFHQVPKIGDLHGVRQRFCGGLTVAAATVAQQDHGAKIGAALLPILVIAVDDLDQFHAIFSGARM